MTSLPPGICCLEASPWRPEGSGWVKIANPRGCKFQESESEKRKEYMFLLLARTETPSWRLMRGPWCFQATATHHTCEPSGDCLHPAYSTRQAPSWGHLQAYGPCWDIESCFVGVSLPQKGEVASLLEELSFLLLQAELWPQTNSSGWGAQSRLFWLEPRCTFPVRLQQGKATV